MKPEDMLAELSESYIAGFAAHLSEIERLILSLEKQSNIVGDFDALYRRVHSIKGSAGTLGFNIISAVCHQFEDYLTQSVGSVREILPEHVVILFSYLDLLHEVKDSIQANTLVVSEIERKLDQIAERTSAGNRKCLCVGFDNTFYGELINQAATMAQFQCSFESTGLAALQRLLHEKFDLLVTARENTDIRGEALVAALRLNNARNKDIKTILITSRPLLDVPEELAPDYILLKKQDLNANLLKTFQAESASAN